MLPISISAETPISVPASTPSRPHIELGVAWA